MKIVKRYSTFTNILLGSKHTLIGLIQDAISTGNKYSIFLKVVVSKVATNFKVLNKTNFSFKVRQFLYVCGLVT